MLVALADTTFLRAVIHDLAIDLPALLLRPGQLSRTHLQHGLDRGSAHHVNQIINRTLRLLDEINQRQDQLPHLASTAASLGESGSRFVSLVETT